MFAIAVTLASATPIAAEEDLQEAHVEAKIVGGGHSLGVGFGSLWVVAGNQFDRIDLNNNVVTHVPIRGFQNFYGGLAIGEGAVWVSDGRMMLYKIDPQREKVVREMGVADFNGFDRPWGFGVGEGAIWALTGAKELRRYSTESGAEEAVISLPSSSYGVLVAFGSVWVSGTGEDELYRIDPTINQITATVEVGARPRALAAGEGAVWVINEGDGAVQRIDGNSGKLLATIATNTPGKLELAAGGGYVWVATRRGTVMQIDPQTGSMRSKFKINTWEVLAVSYANNSLWVAGDSIQRVTPPR
jgi:hypothetical protein